MPFYTIDNFWGDERPGQSSNVPIYLPPSDQVNQWDIPGGRCSGCAPKGANFLVSLDTSKVHNGTYRSVTMNPGEPLTTLGINFMGTWVAVYSLLPPYLGADITSSMNLTFAIDGNFAGNFERPTSLESDWTYNVSVFSSDQLDNQQHTLVVTVQPGTNSSLFLFDYAAYEFSDPSIPPSPPTDPPQIPSGTSTIPGSSIPISMRLSSATSSTPEPSKLSNSLTTSSLSKTSPLMSSSAAQGEQEPNTLPSLTNTSPPSTASDGSTPRTTVDPANSDQSRSSTTKALILCGVVGGVAMLLLLTTILFLLRRARRRGVPRPVVKSTPASHPTTIAPFVPISSASFTSQSLGGDMHSGQSSEDRAVVRESLQRRHDELEAQLSSVDDTEPDADHDVVAELRRELEVMRARIMDLQNAGFDEPPPSYVSVPCEDPGRLRCADQARNVRYQGMLEKMVFYRTLRSQ